MIEGLSGTAANVIGLVGTACVLAAFAYINLTAKPNGVLFNAANLIGALLLMISLLVHFNLASFLLEIAWASIALWGLARALYKKDNGGAA
ncbi:CBU_0592 family membrane protein [Sphingopyxis indica]|uniref:CBU-0592-like domain-containing protein n=1 Tax=Sphingopyxis indica TaxID=436663 RepID=A0A239FQP4_9SPHN|nr:hypothetical protein [Sphingopyxis indica]SNS59130.1 hypothetical protein SAMN06295955_102197 [Sphingopyxis indica]